MTESSNLSDVQPQVAARGRALLSEAQDRVFCRTDRMFAALLAVEYFAGVAAVLWLSPRTWIGATSSLHVHVLAAVVLNAIITLPPILLAVWQPGRALTRHVIAFAQMMQSAMLIHFTGGRIETHFHVFGSLAFLAFYRDWRPLITATVVVAVDHCIRGVWYPQSVYGVISASPFRWLEHAAWVLFEDLFLIRACTQGASEMRQIAQRQAQLEEEVRQREAASRAKSEFLATMSHEIRTPINGVIGTLELITDTSLTRQQATYLDAAHSSANTLLTLINDILDFSKIEAGQFELSPVEFDIEALLEETMAIFTRRASNKGLELVYHIGPEVHTRLVGDPDRLRQVLINLIGNAIKFTQTGEVAVRVSVEHEVEASQTICFTVHDTGIGIPDDRRDRLFRSFSQVDSSMSRKYGGTGLGLAICKQLCELMGGQIGVESVAGQGSTFHFTVVLGKPTATRDVKTIPECLDGLRLLIVDDNHASRAMLTELASRWRFNVESAPDGTTALRMIADARRAYRPFALAILDSVMPGMSGMELAAAIRRDTTDPQMRIILCVIDDDEVNEQALQLHQVAGLLPKPVNPSRLFDLIIASFMDGTSEGPPGVKPAGVVEAQKSAVKARILIAEDNPVNQLVAMELLKADGHEVTVAGNGREAVEAVRCGEYDIILMDCQMPEMDGYEATRQINEAADLGLVRRPTIIALTANAIRGDRERCLAAGMDDYVAKPIDRALLMSKIAGAMSGKVFSAQPPMVPQETPITSHLDRPPSFENAAVDAENSDDAPAPIVVEQLLHRCMNKSAVAVKVLELFGQTCPPDTQGLAAAIVSGDADKARELAHRIKGVAAQIAAVQLQTMAAELEQHAKAGQLDAAKTMLTRLQAEVDRCVNWVPQLTHEICS